MKISLPLGVLVFCAVTGAFAQPPNLVRLIRNGTIEPYGAANAAVNVVGMSAISGPAETWLIEMHDSFASLEGLDRVLSGVTSARPPGGGAPQPDDVLTPSRSIIAVYRPGLSYRPEQAAQIFARMRYLEVVICRIRPGTESDFAKVVKLRNFGLDSVNSEGPEIAYQVISGGTSGTWIFVAPIVSLRSLDDGRAQTPVYAEGADAAEKKIAADIGLVRERFWLRIEPRMSYVSEGFAAADSAYWHPASK